MSSTPVADARSSTCDQQPAVLTTPLLGTGCQIAVAYLLLALYAVAYALFWRWWILIHSETGWPALDMGLTFLAICTTVDDLFRQAMLLKATKVNQDLLLPSDLKVGMVVTKAPSEPWEVLEKTLNGMLNQDFPHPYDVWLADEAPSDATRTWCKEHGVRISSRQGVTKYHQPCWPRRTRCKEGNLAYFYDHYGYALYDVICQFDADHVPEPSYLRTLIPAFQDPEVGYVALPSICGANSEVSWAVRGRLYQEAYMHGPLGASMSKIALPCCIGSHYAVRTAALKKVGGIGPELNEDFSTSYILTASGYRGIFSIDTIANGDGPANFEDCMRQEYQWARSAMVLATVYLGSWWPGDFTPLEMFRAAQTNAFWLVQSYAALLTLALVIGPCLFGLQLMPAIDHSLKAFLTDMMPRTTLPQIALSYCSWLFGYAHGWMRPVGTKYWSYELWMHGFCKPWWILQGTIHGLLGGLLGINFAIKVTPKGDNGEVFMGVKNLIPFLFCASISIAALAFGSSHFLAPICLALWHLLVAAIIVALHYKENHQATVGGPRGKFPWHNFLQLSVPIVLLAAGFCTVLVQRHDVIFADVWWGQEASAMAARIMQEQCGGSDVLSYNVTNASMPVINGTASDLLCKSVWAPDT